MVNTTWNWSEFDRVFTGYESKLSRVLLLVNCVVSMGVFAAWLWIGINI